MRQLIIYSFLLTALFLFGYSCASDHRSADMSVAKTKKAKNDFILEDLGAVNSDDNFFQIGSQLAEQKLKDLEDYINLLTQDDIPLEFEDRIKGQIDNLIYNSDSAGKSNTNLREWIQQRIEDKQKIVFSDIKVIQDSLEDSKEGVIINSILDWQTSQTESESIECQFLIQKVNKTFGSKTISVNEMKIIGIH